MEDIINVLSGRSETILLLKSLIQEHGEEPENWLKVFYKKAKELGK